MRRVGGARARRGGVGGGGYERGAPRAPGEEVRARDALRVPAEQGEGEGDAHAHCEGHKARS